ncbi:SLBB domain-containing protein [Salisaeta longa]|uniref:SLBB domain-containing protein n=1 Tax=Salisaeta longa TaxID=503170 RepID=UPI0003B5E7A2|nr:SLBB domain-containing protein [Salisaeta longa]
MTTPLTRWIGPVLLLLLAWSGPAHAQEIGRIAEMKETNNVAYFYFARPGQATVQVQLWGTVPRPGIYEIPINTDLDKLLTMAGGAPIAPRGENQDPPKIYVRVFRPATSTEAPLFEARLQDMLRGGLSYPDLQDGDIITVETIRPPDGFTWRDALSLTSTGLSLTLLLLRIFDRT